MRFLPRFAPRSRGGWRFRKSILNTKNICKTHKWAIIEHPFGTKNKYIPVQKIEDLLGREFHGVEKTDDWFFLTNNAELFDYACVRILGS